jgi:choline dehydrogenase-like flavoprotein
LSLPDLGLRLTSFIAVFSNKEASGTGPSEELASHGISTLHDLPGVGKNLQDHTVAFRRQEVDPILSEIHEFGSDADGILRARQEWLTSSTGPRVHHNASVFDAFLKLPHLEELAEFKALDQAHGHISRNRRSHSTKSPIAPSLCRPAAILSPKKAPARRLSPSL